MTEKENHEKKDVKKRSSLKMSNCLTPEELSQLQKRCKRLSVNWDASLNLKSIDLKNIKTSFEQANKASVDKPPKKDAKFEEARKKSIKNEFTLVKEMMKEHKIDEEELTQDKEISQNTLKNLEVGKIPEDNNSNSQSDNEE